MDLSIIIVNWNTKELLYRCIKSIKSFSPLFEIEIIVVDNGSVDGSVEFIRQNYPDVVLIENKANLGFARANNIGMNKSTGRYVCLVNSDVRLLKDCLDNFCDFMDRNPKVGIAGPKVYNPDMSVQDTCRKFPSIWTCFCQALGFDKLFPNSRFFSGEHMWCFSHDKTIRVDSLAGCFLLVRRDALNEVGPFDERFFIYAEETDWCKRFRQRGWEVAFFSDAAIIHDHAGSSSKDPVRFEMERMQSYIKYWKKHHSLASNYVCYSLLAISHIARISLMCISSFASPLLKTTCNYRLLKHKQLLRALMLSIGK